MANLMLPPHVEFDVAAGRPTIVNATITASKYFFETKTYTGAVYDEAGRLVSSVQRPAHLWNPIDPETVPAVRAQTQESGIYLGHFFPHFGHFLIETLTALHYAAGNDLPLLFHRWRNQTDILKHPYVAQSLHHLGVQPDRLAFIDKPTRVTRLYLPHRGDPMGGVFVPETLAVYSRVADAAVAQWPDTGARRVYLSRRLWPHNVRVVEEDRIEQLLSNHEFRIVYPEQMHFTEQVAMIRRARVVAGVKGSNLHLSGFMRRNSRLISLGKRLASLSAACRHLEVKMTTIEVNGDRRVDFAALEKLVRALPRGE